MSVLESDVLESLAALRRQGQAAVLVTVISKEGHGPATPGAKMLVSDQGRIAGTIGGGALEHIATRKARDLLGAVSADATLCETYNFNNENAAYAAAETSDRAGSDTSGDNAQTAANGDSARANSSAGGAVFRDASAQQATGSDQAALALSAGSAGSQQPAQATGMVCGGRASLFYERYGAGENLILFGAGHIGRALARRLPGLGYTLTVSDSRGEFIESFEGASRRICHDYGKPFAELFLPQNPWIVIATHSHDLDYQALEQVFRAQVNPRYVGVVASRKKRDLFFARLREAVPGANTSAVYMPAGLDIGGTGPEEIALSIMSELQALRYSRCVLKHMRDERGE
jgi:xanthine dehydrogenase accessory factor